MKKTFRNASLDCEAGGLEDGLFKLIVQSLLGRVGRQVEPVEAGVRLGQRVGRGVGHQVQREEARRGGAGGALQRAEAGERHAARARHELQQARAHVGVPLLHGLPEPEHERRVGRHVLEARVAAPVARVEVGAAGQQRLQVARRQRPQQLRRDDVGQAALQRQPLALGAAREAMRHVQAHVLALVGVRHHLVGAARPQLHAAHRSERRAFHGESRVYHARDTVFAVIFKWGLYYKKTNNNYDIIFIIRPEMQVTRVTGISGTQIYYSTMAYKLK